MSNSFVHLHTHSSYSLLDGVSRIDDLLRTAIDEGMPAVALTDHGVMHGAIEWVSRARELGIKPIVGCEVYVADRPLEQRPDAGAQNYHLVLLAQNEVGYRNLIQLSTAAHLQGFYRKPRVDRGLLERHHEGLICLSACASGEVASRIVEGDQAGAEEVAAWYADVFRDRYFLEMQFHDLAFDATINQGIVSLHQRTGIPLVATNDVHYVQKRHAYAQEVLLCIQTQTTMNDPKRMRMESQEFYLKSAEEMRRLFGDYPGAIANTLEVADRCHLAIAFDRPLLPTIEIPAGRTAISHLTALCEEGMAKRYRHVTDEVRARLAYELDVIERTGFTDYFLLVHDIVDFARRAGIPVGPGRGSAAGALVAYCLFLTNVDPIAHGLSFERFLNAERVSMPDMDLDFADDRRDEVICYITDRFGRDRVAQIITFGTIGPRAGIRDVGRALAMPYGDLDRVAKLVPPLCGKTAKAREEVPELRHLYEQDPAIRHLLETVEDLEGTARHASTHAAGVVISRDPLTEHVPLYRTPKNDQVTTQYAMDSVEKIGLLKMDILGLRTLSVLKRACEFVREATGEQLEPDGIPLDDPSIYSLLSSGETFGLFQVDGQGMRKAIKQVQPSTFEHVVALNSLYRPGPMENIEEFAARKNGRRTVRYDHPALEEVLRETFGIVVYQEQVMRLAALVAGYTMGEADLLRRAMGKKKPEELARHKEQFIRRAEERGTPREVAEHLFQVIEPFAGYAFNKSHSAAYAVITCQTAYLKANHPREFLAGLLSAERDNAERVTEAMGECRRLGITIFPPDVNRSELDFTLETDGIRWGLSAVKHVGAGAIDAILREREQGGEFASLEDLCARLDWNVVNRRVLESLARCGALDSLGIERGRVVASVERLVSFGTRMQRAAQAGQVSLFGDAGGPEANLQLAVADPASIEDLIAWEEELLGIPISRHPVIDAEGRIRQVGAVPVREATAELHGQALAVGGLTRGLRTFSTRDGKPMASFHLTDLQSTLECVVFTRSYEQLQGKLRDGEIVVVDGKLDAADGRVRLMVSQVCALEEAAHRALPGSRNGANRRSDRNGSGRDAGSGAVPSPAPATPGAGRRVTIHIERTDDRTADLARVLAVYAVVLLFPGSDEVELLVRQGTRTRAVPLPHRGVCHCPALEAELRALAADTASLIVEAPA